MMKGIVGVCALSMVLFANAEQTIQIGLDSAIEMALKKSHEQKISNLNFQVAQAQYKQAMSANYPILDLDITGARKDEETNVRLLGDIGLGLELTRDLAFSKIYRQTGNLATSQAQANAITEAGTLPIDSNLTYAGRDSLKTGLNLTYPLYTGGKITAIIEQAKLNKRMAQTQIELNKDEIIYNVTKIYYGYVLAKVIEKTTHDTLERMKLVEDLTKNLFQSDSLEIKKTDFLDVKLTVSLLKAQLQKVRKNVKIAHAALANMIGVPYFHKIQLKQTYFDKDKIHEPSNLNEIISDVTNSNQLLYKIELAIQIAQEKVHESNSAYLPTMAFFANASTYSNRSPGGHNTQENQESWAIGLNIKMNLFHGFKDENMALQKRIERRILQSKKENIKELLSLQVQDAYYENEQSFFNIANYQEAVSNATQNRALNIKAYKIGLEKTDKVIESQLKEFKTVLHYQRALHEYFLSDAKIRQLVSQ